MDTGAVQAPQKTWEGLEAAIPVVIGTLLRWLMTQGMVTQKYETKSNEYRPDIFVLFSSTHVPGFLGSTAALHGSQLACVLCWSLFMTPSTETFS